MLSHAETLLNGSCGRSNTSASIGWCPSVSAISDGLSENLLITTIANGIIKDSRIGSSRGARFVDARAGFVGVCGSVDC